MRAELRRGGVLPFEAVYNNLKAILEKDTAQCSGFVLDGAPFNSAPSQIELLTGLAKNGNCVLIDLRINDQDLIRRRAANWLDPITNISYPGQQILYSLQKRHEGLDVDIDSNYNRERNQRSFKMYKEVKEEIDEEEPDSVPTEKLQKAPEMLLNQTSYPVLEEKILVRSVYYLFYTRLIKTPENDPDVIVKELENYKAINALVENFRNKAFNALQIVELDATQHPDVLFDQLQARMVARGYSIYRPLYEVFRLNAIEGVIQEPDLTKYYCRLALREGEPVREVSQFQKFCPVSFSLNNLLVESKMDYIAVYKVPASLNPRAKFTFLRMR